MNALTSFKPAENTARKASLSDIHIGNQLRLARIERGVSQSALGEALNVTFQQIQKYERGTNRISASTLNIIAFEFGLPITYFFECPQHDTHPQHLQLTQFIQSPEGVKLATVMNTLPASARNSVMNVATQVSSAISGSL